MPATTLIACLGLAASAFAQQGRVAKDRSELEVTMGDGPGVMYLEGGEPEFIGWTYRYNDASGEYEAMKPAFTTVPTDDTGAGSGFLEYWRYADTRSYIRSTSLSASVSYNAWVVSTAATIAGSWETHEGTLSSAVFLGFESDYPAFLADLATQSNIKLSPQAAAILESSMSEDEKAAAWLAAGFGPLVAFGADVRGHLGLKLSLNHSDSYSSRKSYFDLVAKYYNWGAGMTLEDALQEVLGHDEISLNLDYEGLTTEQLGNLTVPSMDVLQDPTLLDQWVADTLELALQAKKFKGLYLAPVSALLGGPDVSVPPWDEFMIQEAAHASDEGLHALSILSQWNQPFALRSYLEERINPSTGRSFWNDLLLVRSELVAQIGLLRDAIVGYLENENYKDPLYSARIYAAIDGVRAAVASVWPFQQQLESFANSLPVMSLVQDVHWHSDGPDSWVWIPVYVELQGAGFFRDGSTADIENALREDRVVVAGDPLYNHGQSQSSTGGINNLFVESVEHIPGGEEEDLLNIRFRFEVRLHSESRFLDLRIEDDLGRAVVDHFSWGL